MDATAKKPQIRLSQRSPGYMRVTFDNPPLNLMGPQFVLEIREIMNKLEADDQVKVVVFDSAVEGFFLNHSDFFANFDDLKNIPPGPTGLEALRAIIAAAPKHLQPRGLLALEHGMAQASAVAQLLQQHSFDSIRTHHDFSGKPRVTLGVLTQH